MREEYRPLVLGDWSTAAGSGVPSLLHAGLFGLDRWTGDRAIRTKHTTIAGFGL